MRAGTYKYIQKPGLKNIVAAGVLAFAVLFSSVGIGFAQTTSTPQQSAPNVMTDNPTLASDPQAAKEIAQSDQAIEPAETIPSDLILGRSVDARAMVNDTMATRSASCDRVNIIYCGLGGSTVQGRIDSLKGFYNANRDSYGNTDLRAVMRWGGITKTRLDNMNTKNTKMGTLYRNGEIRVGGKVVARNTSVTARFGAGRAGFVHVTTNVWARKTTTSFLNPSAPVLIHFNGEGKPIAGLMVNCGNVLRFTGITPSKPSVKIEKTVSKNKLQVYENFEYKIKVTNTGNVALKNVLVRDNQPKNIKFLSASKGKITGFGQVGQPDSTSASWQYTIPELKAKDSQVFTIKAKVTKYVAKEIVNKACVNAPAVNSKEPKKWDDCDDVPVTVKQQKGSVKIVKKVSKDQVNVNEEFVYTLKVTNNGDRDLSKVFVYDCQPSNIKFLKADQGTIGEVKRPGPKRGAQPASCQGWSFVIPELKVDQDVTFKITAKVTKYVKKAITNKACVNAPEVNPGLPEKNDDCDDKPVKVNPPYYACDGDVQAIVDPTDKMKYTVSTKMKYSEGVTFKEANFDFGDGKKETVNKENPAKTVQAIHTYTEAKTFSVRITLKFIVNGETRVANQTCNKQVTVVNPYYSCVRLEGTAIPDEENAYTFVATANFGNGVTFKEATFDFGDGQKEEGVTDISDDKKITVEHAYEKAGTYTVEATLSFTYNGNTVKAAGCRALVTSTVTPECKPGIPMGDIRCNPCPYDATLSADDVDCKRPVISLPNTGTGGIVAVGLAAVVGSFLAYKHLVLRRHKTALIDMKRGVTNMTTTPKKDEPNKVRVSDHSGDK